MYDKITQTVDFIFEKTANRPKIGIILGSGLGKLVDDVEIDTALDYAEIPHFPVSTAPGHAGKLIFGALGGVDVCCMQGRFHYYEGYTSSQVVFPIRVMKRMGIDVLILTNAAGSLSPHLMPGEFMLIRDHINAMGFNPLIGQNDDRIGERFIDMSQPYDLALRETAYKAAEMIGIDLAEGVYVSTSGPSFETASEVRMYGMWGGDAVGMSTVPEVIAAQHCGLRVLGISMISNLGTGISTRPLSGEEVLEIGNQKSAVLCKLVKTIVTLI